MRSFPKPHGVNAYQDSAVEHDENGHEVPLSELELDERDWKDNIGDFFVYNKKQVDAWLTETLKEGKEALESTNTEGYHGFDSPCDFFVKKFVKILEAIEKKEPTVEV